MTTRDKQESVFVAIGKLDGNYNMELGSFKDYRPPIALNGRGALNGVTGFVVVDKSTGAKMLISRNDALDFIRNGHQIDGVTAKRCGGDKAKYDSYYEAYFPCPNHDKIKENFAQYTAMCGDGQPLQMSEAFKAEWMNGGPVIKKKAPYKKQKVDYDETSQDAQIANLRNQVNELTRGQEILKQTVMTLMREVESLKSKEVERAKASMGF
jgi:hypothetical protein